MRGARSVSFLQEARSAERPVRGSALTDVPPSSTRSKASRFRGNTCRNPDRACGSGAICADASGDGVYDLRHRRACAFRDRGAGACAVRPPRREQGAPRRPRRMRASPRRRSTASVDLGRAVPPACSNRTRNSARAEFGQRTLAALLPRPREPTPVPPRSDHHSNKTASRTANRAPPSPSGASVPLLHPEAARSAASKRRGGIAKGKVRCTTATFSHACPPAEASAKGGGGDASQRRDRWWIARAVAETTRDARPLPAGEGGVDKLWWIRLQQGVACRAGDSLQDGHADFVFSIACALCAFLSKREAANGGT